MLMKDCYVGMMVIATDEANFEYAVTVEGVIGIVDEIDEGFEDDPETGSIHIRPAGIQTPEEVADLIIRAYPTHVISPEKTDDFFNMGYWVSPEYFEPYLEEPKVAVSLLSYLT